MDKFQAFLDRSLGPIMSKLGGNRYLLAVRDGVVSALPLIIVGSFFLIVAMPPLPRTGRSTSSCPATRPRFCCPTA